MTIWARRHASLLYCRSWAWRKGTWRLVVGTRAHGSHSIRRWPHISASWRHWSSHTHSWRHRTTLWWRTISHAWTHRTTVWTWWPVWSWTWSRSWFRRFLSKTGSRNSTLSRSIEFGSKTLEIVSEQKEKYFNMVVNLPIRRHIRAIA